MHRDTSDEDFVVRIILIFAIVFIAIVAQTIYLKVIGCIAIIIIFLYFEIKRSQENTIRPKKLEIFNKYEKALKEAEIEIIRLHEKYKYIIRNALLFFPCTNCDFFAQKEDCEDFEKNHCQYFDEPAGNILSFYIEFNKPNKLCPINEAMKRG